MNKSNINSFRGNRVLLRNGGIITCTSEAKVRQQAKSTVACSYVAFLDEMVQSWPQIFIDFLLYFCHRSSYGLLAW